MLLAIDVGNTHTVFGVWDGSKWVQTWRHRTDIEATEDEVAAWLRSMFQLSGLEFAVDSVACASVVPGFDRTIEMLAKSYFRKPVLFLRGNSDHGIKVDYQPATAVGADRIANAIGALALFEPPIIVVDFGTATTFDVIDAEGTYLGGAILPGPLTSLQALVSKTAKLPAIELNAPTTAIGKSTTHSIESGIMFGYAGAIDAISSKISSELGNRPTVIATGGLSQKFHSLCAEIDGLEPMLTLDGIRLFASRATQ
jgi:type III pantothenate kinase